MPDAVDDLFVGEILIAARDHRDLVTGGAVGAGQQQMNLLDRPTKHRRNGIKRPNDDSDAHAPGFVIWTMRSMVPVIPAPRVCRPAGADREVRA